MPSSQKSLFSGLIISIFLGITSGVCFALMISTYTAYLTQHNVNLELIGILSLRTIPYSLKFLWAPIVDNHRLGLFKKTFGFRKSWIVGTQSALILSIMLLGFIDIEKHLLAGCFLALITSFLAATHDIAMDGFRIEFSRSEKLKHNNSFTILGFRIGFLISGALALYLSTIISWQYVFILVALSIVPCMLVIMRTKEIKTDESKRYSSIQDWLNQNITKPFSSLLKMPRFYIILCVIAFYKMSDGYLSTLLIPFLMKSGFSLKQISMVSETFGLFCFILGNFIGSYLSQKVYALRNLFIAELLAATTNLTFITLLYNPGDINYYLLATFFESSCAGIANISLINYMSSLCTNQRYTGTHYAFQ
jgi:PAT family beta-lactamase induction signal transducer AmpG